MNRNSRRSVKESGYAAQKMSFPAHILIAVVAIIECLILISFTTYSWIESNSSLVIMNGRQSTTQQESNIVNIDIADTLNYMVNLKDNEEGSNTYSNADLSKFFRYTKNYRYGKASSPDGVTFYFPKRNNTYTSADTFRKGDTTDYNTSYLYFDFVIDNDIGNRDFYFEDDKDETTSPVTYIQKVFDVDDPSSYFDETKTYTDSNNQTKYKIDALKHAMRISITTSEINKNSNIETPGGTVIYSITGDTYAAQNGLTDDDHLTLSDATIEKLEDYGLQKNALLDVNDKKKLFTSKKNYLTKVSVRVWFEIMDPDFQRAFNITRAGTNPNAFSDADFAAIAGVAIKLNISLKNSANSYVPFYFDDYTLDNSNSGKNMTLAHVSDANENYKVWFRGYDPDSDEWTDFELTRESTNSARTRWSAEELPSKITDYLQNGIGANLSNCYFIYGTSPTDTNGKKWNLTAPPTSGGAEFVYSAYSTVSDGSNTYGVGAWTNEMRMVYFKDMATASVTGDFNGDTGNYRFMNARAAENSSNYHVFVNNTNDDSTLDNNFTESVAKATASMYYDSTNAVFKSYVPASWLSNSGALYFNYSYNGVFSRYGTNVRWFARASTPMSGIYTYTALGYSGNCTIADTTSSQTAYYDGVGTWGEVERINLSAELIDYDHAKEYRYFVGINGSYGKTANATAIYPLIPDANNMLFSAYIPSNLGVNTTDLSFYRFDSVGSVSGSQYPFAGVSDADVTWTGASRGTASTYYPVSTSAGYWHLSVLVDGTYENLIYDTLTDSDGMATGDENSGVLRYSIDNGTSWTTLKNQSNIDVNRIDAYRWYVNRDPDGDGVPITTDVMYQWTPYYGADKIYSTGDDVAFTFTHDASDGMYLVVLEAPNNANLSGTVVQRLAARRFVLETLAETGLGENPLLMEEPIGSSEDAPGLPYDAADGLIPDTQSAPYDEASLLN